MNDAIADLKLRMAANPPPAPAHTVAEIYAQLWPENKWRWLDALFEFALGIRERGDLFPSIAAKCPLIVALSLEDRIDEGWLRVDKDDEGSVILSLWRPEGGYYKPMLEARMEDE